MLQTDGGTLGKSLMSLALSIFIWENKAFDLILEGRRLSHIGCGHGYGHVKLTGIKQIKKKQERKVVIILDLNDSVSQLSLDRKGLEN